MFDEMKNEWQALVARVSQLENQLNAAMSSPTPQPEPAQMPYSPVATAPQTQPAEIGFAPPPTPAPATPAPQPGPTPVPTREQLTSRLMDLNQAKGEAETVNLIGAYGGKDEAGNIRISLVPQEQYAALYAAAGQKLGVH